LDGSIKHFLITRFSYRQSDDRDRTLWPASSDPLNPIHLDRRLDLLATVVVPGILAQTSQNFTWIILVDPALPPIRLAQLKRLTKPCRDVSVIEYEGDRTIEGVQWLSAFLSPAVTHVITTNVDDDDVPRNEFVKLCQDYVERLHKEGRLRSVAVIGTTLYSQWDLVWGRNSPLGYTKPWTRGQWPTNAWLTLCSKFPEQDVSVLALRHVHLPDLLAAAGPRNRKKIQKGAERCQEDWESWSPDTLFHDLGKNSSEPTVLVGNHFWNDQFTRIFEGRKLRQPFDPSMFSGFSFDAERLRRFLKDQCKPNLRLIAGLYRRGTRKKLNEYATRRSAAGRFPPLFVLRSRFFIFVTWNIIAEILSSRRRSSSERRGAR